MVRVTLTACYLLLFIGTALGQNPDPVDTATVSDSTANLAIDSVQLTDTLPPPLADNIDDSIRIVFPNINPDTLSENQRLLAEHETRLNLRMLEIQATKIQAEFSYQDSLVAYYLTPRWNLRDDIDRSFFHDAGDYFKSDPAFFVLEPQTTPIRKTVQPYGLTGNRLGLLIEGRPLNPFEHILEPDGLVDLNDVPTALDHTVAALSGPVGIIFGSGHSVATLLTLPKPPEGTNPESSFIVDKGTFEYSHARGKYRKNFLDGRRVDMSLAYRSSDGLASGRGDDAYHYTGNVHLPLGEHRAVRFNGRLYDRSGPYLVRPGLGGNGVTRNRFDRSADVLFLSHNEEHTQKYEFGYSHLRQASYTNGIYRATLDLTGHGLHLAREWAWSTAVLRASLEADYSEFNNWYEQHIRHSGTAHLSYARLTWPTGIAFDLRQTYVEGYRWLPSAAAMMRRETEKSYLMLSGSYSERAPSLLERYLPYQKTDLYQTGFNSYADGGYPNLVSEKMLTGAIEFGLGRQEQGLMFSAIGGKVWDGIDWLRRYEGDLEVYTPVNGDINFANVTGTARFELSDFLHFKGGGSYHYTDYELLIDPAYSPEYQFFSGMELHLFWSQKLIDLWAYGEVVYTGPYHGFVGDDLGEQAIVNVKLSFNMGHFRFHFVSQNALSVLYYPKDGWQNPGRYTTYGFTWDFID
ncbi:MAG: hypothetical protein J7J98_01750 [candidate division Zixibacteria bacterium]|nr:hypothetical protein [candidate division Zixibacteria bacterium]